MNNFLLSTLIFLPILGSAMVLLLPSSYRDSFKWISVIVNVINLLNIITLYNNFDRQVSDYQFIEQHEWIRMSLGNLGVLSIDYLLGVDGINMPMILLSGIVLLIGSISSFTINYRHKAYHSLYLLLSGSIIGCFAALDFFLFFLFFEFMLLPMYFLIGIWGGERREYAAIKFFIYTLVGSIFILIVMIGLSMSVQDSFFSREIGGTIHTFDFRQLVDFNNYIPNSLLHPIEKQTILGVPARLFAFVLLIIGFGIKLPSVPFHTWLPDAHVEAPTPVSVVLAGVLLKVGAYGFIRIAYGFFPDIAYQFTYIIAGAGIISIIYGAYNALAQADLKKMIAYSSISHMGFVLLGLASLTVEGVNGTVYQMFGHGLVSAMLFLVAGVIYDRTHNRLIENFRGLSSAMPYFTLAVTVAFFGALGLPTLPGFIGEFFTIMGGFQSTILPDWSAMLAMIGIVLSAGYFLWTMQKMFFGTFWANRGQEENMKDLDLREIIMLYSLALLSIIFGIFPNLIFDISGESVKHFLQAF
ncbi:proton-translocating NADH-quinone oxidoreductase, chain M [Emticicia oligotrophica DSM 17448]|uniref:Proton-translocating NADH-quinone oxidoreductase, chain M n=1 Tax=Emticicia oligotrophica (strain DSM 17448 / CIP 109782 / MTCC 6937 / GPTSA100-15) TaxID=929562 RepID=A0ABM5N545_EMTOG|nr:MULTISPECIES: NADH-quinone oxidoreductase subunit M [Emticicia]AFK04588.1 proton-translocating NADH-quinone oxidoreductase, chain M [Emticicia oligotrophica DSM 17448]